MLVIKFNVNFQPLKKNNKNNAKQKVKSINLYNSINSILLIKKSLIKNKLLLKIKSLNQNYNCSLLKLYHCYQINNNNNNLYLKQKLPNKIPESYNKKLINYKQQVEGSQLTQTSPQKPPNLASAPSPTTKSVTSVSSARSETRSTNLWPS